MKKKHKIPRPCFTPLEAKQHRESMEFCDQMTRMVNARVALAVALKSEHERVGSLLSVALADLHSVQPMLLTLLERIHSDTVELARKAAADGRDDLRETFDSTLSTWSEQLRLMRKGR